MTCLNCVCSGDSRTRLHSCLAKFVWCTHPWSHSAVARWHLMVHISLKSCAHLSQAVRFNHSHQWGLVENYYATIARYHSCMVLMPITYQFLGWLVVSTTPKIYFEHQLYSWMIWLQTLVYRLNCMRIHSKPWGWWKYDWHHHLLHFVYV